VVAKVRENLAVSKEVSQNFDVGKLNLRELHGLEFRKQYQIKISNSFAALDNLSDSEDINRAWENMKENIITSAEGSLCLYGLKQHKLWFDKEFLRFLDQGNQASMQWLTTSKLKQCI
jgi:hypothetical protein